MVFSLLAARDTAVARNRLSVTAIDDALALLRRQALRDGDKGNGSCCIPFLRFFSFGGEAAFVVATAWDGVAIAAVDDAHAVKSSATVDKSDGAAGVAAARPADAVISLNDAVAVQGRGSGSLLFIVLVGVGVSRLVVGHTYGRRVGHWAGHGGRRHAEGCDEGKLHDCGIE